MAEVAQFAAEPPFLHGPAQPLEGAAAQLVHGGAVLDQGEQALAGVLAGGRMGHGAQQVVDLGRVERFGAELADRSAAADECRHLVGRGQAFRQGQGVGRTEPEDGQRAGGADRQAVLAADAVMRPGRVERRVVGRQFDNVKGAIVDAGPALGTQILVDGELQIHGFSFAGAKRPGRRRAGARVRWTRTPSGTREVRTRSRAGRGSL